MTHLGTFNLFWFPAAPDVAENVRSPEDELLVARVVERLAADALVFQEILDVEALQRVLELVPHRNYRVLEATPAAAAGELRVAGAFDDATLTLVENTAIMDEDSARRFSRRRPPLAMVLRHRASQTQFWFVGVHFKSGHPTAPDATDEHRRWEAEAVAAWVTALPADAPPVFILGDFNLVGARPPLASLTAAGAPTKLLQAATLDAPPDQDGVKASADEQWSTLLDGVVIDHAFTARGATGNATIVAFDLDPALAELRKNGVPFFRVEQGSEYWLKPYKGAPKQEVRAMYRVSDHRPLVVDLPFENGMEE